jgi:hypothetical protein
LATYDQSEYDNAQYGPGPDVIDQGIGNSAYVACAPWIDTEQLCCEGEVPFTDCEGDETVPEYMWSDAEIIQAATNILYNLTCQKFPGICRYQVRPCIGCAQHPCRDSRIDAILLPTKWQVWGIVSITIDGVVLDPSLYRLVGKNMIVRTDCEPWPRCQLIGGCGSCCSDVVVVYDAGVDPPIELKMAVADLACEIKKACNGDAGCKLPDRVKSITRRGVEMEFDEVGRVISEGRTGIKSVDIALDVYGDCSKSVTRFFDPLSHPKAI